MANQQLNPATDHGRIDLGQQISDLEEGVNKTIQGLRDQLTLLQAELTLKETTLSAAIEQAKSAAITSAEQKAVDLASQAQTAANNNTQSAVDTLRSDIQNGNIIAQKAEMLKARDGNHWMRFNMVNNINQDTFMLWRTDNQWFPLIRVQAASEADEVTSDVLRKITALVSYSRKGDYDIFVFPNLEAWDVYASGGVYTGSHVRSRSGPPW